MRKSYQQSIVVSSTEAGPATLKQGIVYDGVTGKFMGTYEVKGFGSISKIFACKQDCEFWYDSLHSLHLKGRLAGNLGALRQAEASRKATAAVIEKIMQDNITMEGEQQKGKAQDVKGGRDFFPDMFPQKKGSPLPAAAVRLYKGVLDQLLTMAMTHEVKGVVLGLWNAQLGWRSTTCMVLGHSCTKQSIEEFVVQSGLIKLGIISYGTSQQPTDEAFAELKDVANGECKTPLLAHFVREKFKVSHVGFELDASTGNPKQVTLETLSRRVKGETFQVLGTGAPASKASTARSAVHPLHKQLFWSNLEHEYNVESAD